MGPQWPKFATHRKKLLVFGSRSLDDRKLVERKLDKFTYNFSDVVVVSGTADGADKLGEWWGFKNGHVVVRFYPDYDRHGKAAPLYRNVEMTMFTNADGCAVAFHDGYSEGTWSMIQLCRLYDIPLRIVRLS